MKRARTKETRFRISRPGISQRRIKILCKIHINIDKNQTNFFFQHFHQPERQNDSWKNFCITARNTELPFDDTIFTTQSRITAIFEDFIIAQK